MNPQTRGRVAHGGPEAQTDIIIARLRQGDALGRPPVDAPAGDPTRADDEVGLVGSSHARQQFGQIDRTMRSVRVHLEDERIVVGDGPPHAVHVGGCQPGLRGAVQDEEPLLPRAPLVDPLPRAIRRRVVNDEDVGRRKLSPDLVEDPRQRLHLVVGRDDDEGVVALRGGGKTLRVSHESHSACFNEWSHLLGASRRAREEPRRAPRAR